MNNNLLNKEIKTDTYENIKSELTNNKSIVALDRVKEAIDFFIGEKIEFSIAGIGRFCFNKWGSPKVQSIRNSSALMRLIKYEQSVNVFKNNKKSAENNILDLVDDERVKAHIIIQEEMINSLNKKYVNLKKVIQDIQPIDIDKLLIDNLNIDEPVDLINLLPNVEENIDKDIDNYFNEKNKNQANSKYVLSNEQNIKDFLTENIRKYSEFEEFIKIVNTKFLDKLGVQLEFKNNMVINKNTGTVIFEIS